MSLEAIQAAMLRMIYGAGPEEGDRALLAPDAGDPREAARPLVYRALVRERLGALARSALPRTRTLLGEGFEEAISGWLADGPSSARFFRELPLELAAHLEARPPQGAPPELGDLVRLERARWHAMIAVEDTRAAAPFDLEKIPMPSAALTVLTPRFSVHEEGPLREGRFYVCVYRRPDHVVETRWMGPVLGRAVEAWARSRVTAIDAVRAALAAEGVTPDAAFVDSLGELAATLLERGALRGSHPD